MQKLREIINQYRVSILIVGSFLAVVIIGIGVYSWQEKQKLKQEEQIVETIKSPAQILQELEASSQPVTTTEAEQLDTLKKLETSSTKVSASSDVQSQIQILQALEEQSKK